MATPTPPKKPFELELTPSTKPVINPDAPFSMTVKNKSEIIQQIIVEVKSMLFELKEARANQWPRTQIYHKVEPGGTMSFQIGLAKLPKKRRESWLEPKKKEGVLKVYHIPDTNMDDTDDDWGFECKDPEYMIMPGYRFVPTYWDVYNEHEHVEMELIMEKETKVTAEMRKQLKSDELPRKKSRCSTM